MEKVCVNHPESPSVGSCKACEKPVCLMCITEVQGVSFCSDACGAAYQEVKDWLERPAAEEEWNPLAEAKAKPAPAVKAPAPAPAPAPVAKAPSPAPIPQEPALTYEDQASDSLPAGQRSGDSRTPLYLAIAATVVVVIGAFVLFSGKEEPVTPPPIAKVEPPKPAPPQPVVKVEPPKPEPVKVDPPKPPPPPPPKPEPAKIEPPKPEPAKIEPPKPPPPPPPKPEPAKVEPPKPEPAKIEPPKPPPPPPPPKPEPPPAAHLASVRDPWAKEKTGAWYRIKTTTDGKDSYKDIGLRESGTGYRVIVSQASVEGKTEPEQFLWTEPEEISVFGSVNGDAKGTKYAADVIRSKSSKPSQFVFKDGPHAGAWFAGDATLIALSSATLKVKDREFPCSLLETDLKSGAHAKTWVCLEVPIAAVKTESSGTASVLVDFGDTWEKRPPFPAPPAPVIAKVDPPKPVVPPPVVPPPVIPVPVVPPPVIPAPVVPPPVVPPPPPPPPVKTEPAKVEPPPPPKPEPAKVDPAKEEANTRAKKSIADAGALIKEASPLYSEVSSSMETLPGDKPSLRDLYRKAERVQLKLSDARILYSSVRSDAPDPAVIDRRVKQLDELLEAVQDCLRTIKGRLE